MQESRCRDELSAQMKVERLYISSGHNFFGHHGRPPDSHAVTELEHAECVAGRGIRGDRFFDFKNDYPGQVTFFSREVFEKLCEVVADPHVSPSALRRNILVSGIDLNELIGREFVLQGIRFAGESECAPCYWMDETVGPGAADFLRGKGGLRARILSNGILRRDSQTGGTRERPSGTL